MEMFFAFRFSSTLRLHFQIMILIKIAVSTKFLPRFRGGYRQVMTFLKLVIKLRFKAYVETNSAVWSVQMLEVQFS